MRYNKHILIRISDIDINRINALKQIKKANNEVFNLSALIRNELNKHFENII